MGNSLQTTIVHSIGKETGEGRTVPPNLTNGVCVCTVVYAQLSLQSCVLCTVVCPSTVRDLHDDWMLDVDMFRLHCLLTVHSYYMSMID
jgi:hypothetical protein